MRRFLRTISVSLLLLIMGSSVAHASERYYLLVLAAQSDPPRAVDSHTFATFVKASGEGSNPRAWTLECHTISWMPKNMDIEIRIRPEAGENIDLNESLIWAWQHQAHVSVWGPYEIDRRLYDLALQQIARLERGQMRYRLADGNLRPKKALNGVHAITDLVPDLPLVYTGYAYGDKAGAMAVEHFEPWIRSPQQSADWLLDRLGLTAYGVVRRK
ncbi:MAG TPA: hypothetical protein VGZ47_21910 [Gemmataceae bacterium]|nr:hypothetical protein [Gemmataceae bacterium]